MVPVPNMVPINGEFEVVTLTVTGTIYGTTSTTRSTMLPLQIHHLGVPCMVPVPYGSSTIYGINWGHE